MNNKFSVKFFDRKIKIYKLDHQIQSFNIMTQTIIENEITVFKYIDDDDELFEKHSVIFDPRSYNIINIYEDIPGIDHIGIVNYISSLFLKEDIPLIYINTFSYNLILISDDYIDQVKNILKFITN
jgi:hypothetical protein